MKKKAFKITPAFIFSTLRIKITLGIKNGPGTKISKIIIIIIIIGPLWQRSSQAFVSRTLTVVML